MKTLPVKLEYPTVNEVNSVTIALYDVRAADDIRIAFDHERDGWVIYQADFNAKVLEWVEVGFHESFALFTGEH